VTRSPNRIVPVIIQPLQPGHPIIIPSIMGLIRTGVP
jgi:hypothetical protein